MKHSSFQKKPLWLMALALAAIILYFISPILTPFFIATFIAYIANPSVTRFENSGVPRWVSMVLGIAIIATIISIFGLLLLPTLKTQVSSFIDKLPEYVDLVKQWVQSTIAKFYQVTAKDQAGSSPPSEALNELAKESLPVTGEAAAKTVDAVKASAVAMLKTLTNIFLIPVIAFYLLRDWNSIVKNLKRLIPNGYRRKVYKLAAEVDEVLKSFLYGQFLVMCALGAIYSTGLLVIGLDYSLLIGVMAGLLSFVPFLGTAIGLVSACIVMLIQSGQLLDIWTVLVVFAIGQFVEGNLLTPKLVGEKINLHPVVVIFAVLAGGELFGFTGVLLALPVAAIAWVVIKNFAADTV